MRVGLVALAVATTPWELVNSVMIEPASALRADQASKNRVGNASHRRQHSRRTNDVRSDLESFRKHLSLILTARPPPLTLVV